MLRKACIAPFRVHKGVAEGPWRAYVSPSFEAKIVVTNIMKRFAIRFFLKKDQLEKIKAAAKGSGLAPAAFARMHVLNAARKWKTLPTEDSIEQYCPKCFTSIEGCKDAEAHRNVWTEA